MNKKGIIEGLQALVVPLIAIGIILAVGFLIFAEAKDKIIDITGKSTTWVNESVTWTNRTYVALTYDGDCMTFSCGEVHNSTEGGSGIIPSALYTCTNNKGINLTTTTTNANFSRLINVTYSCTNMTLAFNATSDVQNATQDIPGWLPIIVITVIGALLIGLVTRFRAR